MGETVIQSAADVTVHGAHDPSFCVTVTVTVRWLGTLFTSQVWPFTSGALAVNPYAQSATAAGDGWPPVGGTGVCGTVVGFGEAGTVSLPLPDPDGGVRETAAALPVALGWVEIGPEADGPLHAAIATDISVIADAIVHFIAG